MECSHQTARPPFSPSPRGPQGAGARGNGHARLWLTSQAPFYRERLRDRRLNLSGSRLVSDGAGMCAPIAHLL